MRIEAHRLRIDTVADGLNAIDAILDVFEQLIDGESAMEIADDARATAEFATDDDVEYSKVHFESIAEKLAELYPDDDFASRQGLEEALTRLKMLREWLREAEINYDLAQIHARQTTQS